MGAALGRFVSEEVARAESDFGSLRLRGQAVLATSGGLVTALAGILAFAANSAGAELSGLQKAAASVALSGFSLATLFVLRMLSPKPATAVDANDLGNRVRTEWDDEGWDQLLAENQVTYLGSLRSANRGLARLLQIAVSLQILAGFAVLLLAFLFLERS